jgi:hypothetical protein
MRSQPGCGPIGARRGQGLRCRRGVGGRQSRELQEETPGHRRAEAQGAFRGQVHLGQAPEGQHDIDFDEVIVAGHRPAAEPVPGLLGPAHFYPLLALVLGEGGPPGGDRAKQGSYRALSLGPRILWLMPSIRNLPSPSALLPDRLSALTRFGIGHSHAARVARAGPTLLRPNRPERPATRATRDRLNIGLRERACQALRPTSAKSAHDERQSRSATFLSDRPCRPLSGPHPPRIPAPKRLYPAEKPCTPSPPVLR